MHTECTDKMSQFLNNHCGQESNYKTMFKYSLCGTVINRWQRNIVLVLMALLFKNELKVIANICMPENIFEMLHKTNIGLLYLHKTT